MTGAAIATAGPDPRAAVRAATFGGAALGVDQAPFGPVDVLGADRDRRARHRPGGGHQRGRRPRLRQEQRPRQAGLDPTGASLAGVAIASPAIAVLGVLCISSEYSSGMIRTSLIAVPKRGRVLAAKSVTADIPARPGPHPAAAQAAPAAGG